MSSWSPSLSTATHQWPNAVDCWPQNSTSCQGLRLHGVVFCFDRHSHGRATATRRLGRVSGTIQCLSRSRWHPYTTHTRISIHCILTLEFVKRYLGPHHSATIFDRSPSQKLSNSHVSPSLLSVCPDLVRIWLCVSSHPCFTIINHYIP